MINPLKLIQVLNDSLQTDMKAVFKTDSQTLEMLKDSCIPLLALHDYQIYGVESDLKYVPLMQSLISLQLEDNLLTDNDLAWLDFLEGRQSTAPKFPPLKQDAHYRICKLTVVNERIKQELLELSEELLSGMLLLGKSHEMYLLLEDHSSLVETLNAFYETLALELNEKIQIYLSSKFGKTSEMPCAYGTIKALEQIDAVKSSAGPIRFESYMSELIFEEWLSNEQGPVFKAIQNLGLATLLDDETLRTIDVLFKMNLNLTDTARELFIHRNTLIYRIEKIQKNLGFDLRNFEDCYRLKLLLKVK